MLDGTESPSSSSSSETDFPFSPSDSSATDITDDSELETPVKGRKSSTKPTHDVPKTSQNEEKDELERTEDRDSQRKTGDTQSPTKTIGKTKKAKTLKHRLSASSLQLVDITDALSSNKRRAKESSTSSDRSNEWVSDQQKRISETTLTAPKTRRPLRQPTIEYWTAKQASRISTDFSTGWVLRGRAVSDVGGARKKPALDSVGSSAQNQHTDKYPPPNSIIPRVTISPPEDSETNSAQGTDDQRKLNSKSASPGDGTIQEALAFLLSTTQTSSASTKEKVSMRKSLSKIIPFEIREHLREDNQHCPAWTTKGLRCKKQHRANVSHIIHTLDNLTAIKPSQLSQCMEDLITATVCSASHQRVARNEVQIWERDIDKLCENHNYTVSPSNYRLSALAEWISTLGTGESFSKKVESSPPATVKGNIPSNIPKIFPLIQKFRPYITKKSAHSSVSEVLEKLLIEPLTTREIKDDGNVYVYWQPGNFGHLKIGLSNDITKRMKKWNSDCKKPMEVYYPKLGGDEEFPNVKHVYRVEKLVHTELKNCRRIEEKCPGCGRNHVEWFEVSRDLAVQVVRKWMAWIKEAPYEERSSKTKTEWVLKDEQMKKLKELSQPLKAVSISPQVMEKGWTKGPRHGQRLSVSGSIGTRALRSRSKSM
ncbi:T5orf172 domain-containing protein [Talaromyces proteolyticus]|uniref:T5orf172 domain-containing protein n=1 Tax=Talaromyces proteolyticus TaxID=1131652 RepID=A0AAD4PTZ0_9EURO|nr:T5orf172 domain-containing protein [Talaromyces proteolyticus]KAH8691550.1 T5orf172 domain-containing protein [Talaromyces proteolyticus]